MATLQQMKDQVYYVLRDDLRQFIQTPAVTEWLNEAYLDIVARIGTLRKAATGTTSSTGTVTLPADFIRVAGRDQFYVATDTAGYSESPQIVSDDIFLSYSLTGNEPHRTIARIFNGVIETYPQAVTKAYTLEYVYKPPKLDDGSDEPLLPEELHVKLVNYARAHAKWQEGEMDEGNTYMALYGDGLPGSPDAEGRERGPVEFVPAPSYWDGG